MWAVCTTVTCKNRGTPVDIGEPITDPVTGETTVPEVYCGVCERVITQTSDGKPAPIPTPDPAEELPA